MQHPTMLINCKPCCVCDPEGGQASCLVGCTSGAQVLPLYTGSTQGGSLRSDLWRSHRTGILSAQAVCTLSTGADLTEGMNTRCGLIVAKGVILCLPCRRVSQGPLHAAIARGAHQHRPSAPLLSGRRPELPRHSLGPPEAGPPRQQPRPPDA